MRKLFMCILFSLILLQTAAAGVFAYGAAYTTESYDVEVRVGEDHVCSVTETITVDFHEPRHGIYRYIPYDLGVYTIKNIRAEGETYEVESVSENELFQKIIRIGDADRLVNGRHTYTLSYDVVGYADSDGLQDYFSLDVLPAEWETAIGSADIRIYFPKAVDEADLQIYSGRYGIESNAAGMDVNYDRQNNVLTLSSSDIPHGTAVTVNARLPEGYWQGAASRDWLIYPLMATLVAIPVLMLVLWLLFGRDPKVIKTVEFYPPKGMTPAEIGYVIDGHVDTKDIVSMIVYYASKGYLKIEELEKNEFTAIKLKNIDPKEKTFAKTLFNALFEEGDRVRLDELPESFGEMYPVVVDRLSGYYRRKKNMLFTKASRSCRILGMILMFVPALSSVTLAALASFRYIFLILLVPVILALLIGMFMLIFVFDKRESYSRGKSIAMTVTGVLLLAAGVVVSAMVSVSLMGSLWLFILVPVSTIVTLFFVTLMHARTKQSAKWQGQILGLKEFIRSAELDRLKLLAEENPEYFYDIMPYAYVMGLSDVWISHFEKIPTTPPVWYDGYDADRAFNVIWFGHVMNRCSKSFAGSAISSVASSSADTGRGSIGGGFGGGGFSGGGFGGGGGGSW